MISSEPITQLDIVTGGTCNLKCSYCFLHDLVSQRKLDKLIQETLTNGEYAQICAKVLQVYKNNPIFIKEISCWGGESTLHLSLLKNGMHFWKEIFPNLDSWEFITNGSYKAQDMFELILELDKLKFSKLTIQTSLDGPQEITNERGISVNKILSTLCDLIDLLNTIKLENLKIQLTFKSTAWVNTYNKIHQTIDSATKYYKFWANDVIAQLESHHNNLNMESHIIIAPLDIAYQFDYTQQDGIDFANSLRVYDSLDWDEVQINIPKHYPRLKAMMNYLAHFDTYQENSVDFTSHNYYCGAYTHGLFIRPDGAVLGCLGSLFADDKDFLNTLKDKDFNDYNSFRNVPIKNFVFKPLEVNEKERELFLNHKLTFDNYAYLVVQTSVAIMYDLAYCHQIDSQYMIDIDKAIRHSYLFADKNSCWFNNLKQTGSLYAALPGVYRLLCNGALDYFDLKRKEQFLENKARKEITK